jgi:hypothetical protein
MTTFLVTGDCTGTYTRLGILHALKGGLEFLLAVAHPTWISKAKDSGSEGKKKKFFKKIKKIEGCCGANR